MLQAEAEIAHGPDEVISPIMAGQEQQVHTSAGYNLWVTRKCHYPHTDSSMVHAGDIACCTDIDRNGDDTDATLRARGISAGAASG